MDTAATSGAFAAPPTGACEDRHPEALAEAAQGLLAAQTVAGQEDAGARGIEESRGHSHLSSIPKEVAATMEVWVAAAAALEDALAQDVAAELAQRQAAEATAAAAAAEAEAAAQAAAIAVVAGTALRAQVAAAAEAAVGGDADAEAAARTNCACCQTGQGIR